MTAALAVGVILARGGSKGVPGKNLRRVGGLTLVARSVIAARQSRRLAAVYLSTDDAAIAEEARSCGARVIDRPAALAGDTATSEEGWLHALGTVREDFPDIAVLALIQCTSPFTTGEDIDGCLQEMEARGAACAVSVIEDHPFLWTVGADGFGRGVNHDETRQRARRQELAPCYRESGAIYCVRVAEFERAGRRFCGPVALYPVRHPPIEIDTADELALCDLIARTQAAPQQAAGLAERLAKIRAVVTDFDGVHTDDTVLLDQNGVESVAVSRRDGLGVELLKKSGRWRILILSKEKNPVVLRRAEKLGVDCINASDDKVAALDAWLKQAGLTWDQVLYIGNDVNDAGPLEQAGTAVCPCDAHPSVLALADWIAPVSGGRGVLRAVADRLLALHESERSS